jgi:hypothetical protein
MKFLLDGGWAFKEQFRKGQSLLLRDSAGYFYFDAAIVDISDIVRLLGRHYPVLVILRHSRGITDGFMFYRSRKYSSVPSARTEQVVPFP